MFYFLQDVPFPGPLESLSLFFSLFTPVLSYVTPPLMRHASQGASCCSGPLHCLGAERRSCNHRSAWLELWNAPSSYQTHQEPPSLCQIPEIGCTTSLWEFTHLCQHLHFLRTGLSSGLLSVPHRHTVRKEP